MKSQKQVSEKIYSTIGRVASFYDFLSWVVGYKKSVKYFVLHLPFSDDAPIKVLDAGCGTGVYSLAVLEKYKNAKVTAFDVDKTLVNSFKEKTLNNKMSDRICVFTADITGSLLEIGNEKFDLIITAGVLVYVPHEETIRNLSRFLVTGGYFFNSPNRDSLWGRLVCKLFACKPYSKAENFSAFEKNGFTLVEDIKVPNTPAASFKDAHIFSRSNHSRP